MRGPLGGARNHHGRPTAPPLDAAPLRHTWRSGEAQRDVEEIIRHPVTGELIYRLVQTAPLRDHAGRLLGAVAAVRDVTAQRTAADAQARLLADVQRVNEELQLFAHIVSHDLTEPLRTMTVYVELLIQRAQGTLAGDAAGWMAFVTDAARRMRQMLTDLLAYTRAGQTPEFRPVPHSFRT